METKVLLRLIRDDLKLLDGIVASLISDAQPEPEEVEVALIRAKGIVTELEMLSKNTTAKQKVREKPVEEPVKERIEEIIPVLTPVREEEPELIDLEEEPLIVQDADKMVVHKNPEPHSIEPEPMPMTKREEEPQAKVKEEEQAQAIEATSKPIKPAEAPAPRKEKVVHQPEIGEDHHLKTLGESIVETHQLVHDRWVSEKEEHLFEGKPLKSIREGIGLNDRFLFIRELFSGDSEHYNRTLDELDRFGSIKEAVDYLKMNFKWNKNEAGEKFLHLVKRRYTN